ncbi:hypothetical protein BP00DRAFT_78557 [Aspergillus indologenus CBS 114.80]|uniref:Uncharacterized protein n=1 Tax=Aspergillus indologenus CBS 114.80 TaxID=1450541 RepID=A0A2V5HWQ7_9EURO|nr:hypothetical protein BP00DRAFT_78557 [Aspergillus indologenus CBS 114.80]
MLQGEQHIQGPPRTHQSPAGAIFPPIGQSQRELALLSKRPITITAIMSLAVAPRFLHTLRIGCFHFPG